MPSSPNQPAPGRDLRVLIADDSNFVHEALKLSISCSMLPSVEIVGQARDGDQAVELVRQLRPDVLILDIKMPGLEGPQVLEKMREERLECTVIMLTANTSEENLKKCAALGAKYFYDKGTELEKVTHVLHQLTLP